MIPYIIKFRNNGPTRQPTAIEQLSSRQALSHHCHRRQISSSVPRFTAPSRPHSATSPPVDNNESKTVKIQISALDYGIFNLSEADNFKIHSRRRNYFIPPAPAYPGLAPAQTQISKFCVGVLVALTFLLFRAAIVATLSRKLIKKTRTPSAKAALIKRIRAPGLQERQQLASLNQPSPPQLAPVAVTPPGAPLPPPAAFSLFIHDDDDQASRRVGGGGGGGWREKEEEGVKKAVGLVEDPFRAFFIVSVCAL
ncbi:hypothetical protein GWI33_007300 [Rhynchophorus ferrugineus]|uniref:Uncharacterized protein n=1 Tax=Rhynchophorus ferrugineus TaxID=354439 RepID=A0A834IET5_RHYFE|nr:hypothetical protein GWI33_007300 [Rhynchophorus ferrugineus]